MVATTASIAATTVSVNMSNTSQQLKKANCEFLENSFNNATASIEQKQLYAECIQMLHPIHTTNDILILKGLIILGLVSFVVTAILNYRLNHDILLALLVGLLFGIGLPFAILISMMLVSFLFS